MILVAIDPGLHGGIAAIDADGTVDVRVMPTVRTKVGTKLRTRYDMRAIRELFEGFCAHSGGPQENLRVFIEAQGQAMSKTRGAMGGLIQAEQYGMLLGLLWCMHIPFKKVYPQSWQRAIKMPKFLNYDDRKRFSVTLAMELYPNVSLMRSGLCTREHDGMAESLLILHYGRSVLDRLLREEKAEAAG